MSLDLKIDILAPPAVTLLFFGMSWAWAKTVRRGRPLTKLMKGMLAYGSLFLLGMLYLVAIGTYLHWHGAWISLACVMWGGTVILIAWLRYHRKSEQPHEPSGSKQ